MSIVNNDFHDVLTNRHSVRNFDGKTKISRDEMKEMIKETITAPSGCNLQSWRFLVIDSPEGKKKLEQIIMPFNLKQLHTCSAVVFVLGDTLAYKKYHDLWKGMLDKKRITQEYFDNLMKTFMPIYAKASKETLTNCARIDSCLASMQFMLVAREHGYETNAMAGYYADKLAAEFAFDADRYVPVMAIAIGKPDKSAKEMRSTRYSVAEVSRFA